MEGDEKEVEKVGGERRKKVEERENIEGRRKKGKRKRG